MPDFEVSRVSSEVDPEDGCFLITFDGLLGNTAARFQPKIQGSANSLVATLSPAAGDPSLPIVKRAGETVISPDGTEMRWTLETDTGDQVFVMSKEAALEFTRCLEEAMGPSRQLH